MSGRFILGSQAERDQLDWGSLGWLSRPSTTGAKDLVVIEVNFLPGSGHNFHKHPDQEEVIYVVQGQVEQWLEQSKQVLGPGDSIFISKGVVHASFNVFDQPVKVLAILGPCVTEAGYVAVDMADQEPWKSLR